MRIMFNDNNKYYNEYDSEYDDFNIIIAHRSTIKTALQR